MADANTQGTEGTTTTPQGEGTTQTGAAAQSGERTFTQEEVNKLVGDARTKVRKQYEGYEKYKAEAEAHADYDEVVAARDRALADVESLNASIAHRDLVDRVSADTGVPSALLHGDDEETLRASAEAVSAYVKAQMPSYPQDKGGGASPKPPTHEGIDSRPRDTVQQRMERLMERAALIERETAR